MRRLAGLWVVASLLLGIDAGFASAQSSIEPGGQWVLNLGTRTLLVLSLSSSTTEGQPFTGSLSRPRHFETSDSRTFSHIYGDVMTAPVVGSTWKDGALAITIQNPRDPADKDAFLFKTEDANHAHLQMAGVPLPPIDLVRAKGTSVVASDWDRDKTYSVDDGFAPNPEMKRIFDEDQRARQPGARIDWAIVGKSDAERRRAVLQLLAAGSLHTGEDFTRAAFVFQHGSTSDDYLLAHTLALVALKKGYGNALWIATATLDRYLQSIHQPQVYGTQFSTPPTQRTTQGAYSRQLIPDALRRQLGVPIQAAQEEQRKQYEIQRGIAK